MVHQPKLRCQRAKGRVTMHASVSKGITPTEQRRPVRSSNNGTMDEELRTWEEHVEDWEPTLLVHRATTLSAIYIWFSVSLNHNSAIIQPFGLPYHSRNFRYLSSYPFAPLSFSFYTHLYQFFTPHYTNKFGLLLNDLSPRQVIDVQELLPLLPLRHELVGSLHCASATLPGGDWEDPATVYGRLAGEVRRLRPLRLDRSS